MKHRAASAVVIALISALLASAPVRADHVDDSESHLAVAADGGLTFEAQEWLRYLDGATLARGEQTVGAAAIRRFKLMLVNAFLPPASLAVPLDFGGVRKIEWCHPSLSPGCWYFQRDDGDVRDPSPHYRWTFTYAFPVPDDGGLGGWHYRNMAGQQDYFFVSPPHVAWQQAGNPCGPDAEMFGGAFSHADEWETGYCTCLVPPDFSCPHESSRGMVWKSATKELSLRPQPDDPDVENAEINWDRPGLWEYTIGGQLLLPENAELRNWIAHELAPSRPPIDYDALLQKYSPYLAYEEQEFYFADAASEITDSVVRNPAGRVIRSNRLLRGATVLADADPEALRYPTLSLGLLASLGGLPDDVLDEAGRKYKEDAARMHAMNQYGNHYYGRVVQDPASGEHWLQYWFWFYYNSQTAGFINKGAHEGDWEMIQIALDSSGRPNRVTYAQHKGGQSCQWDPTSAEITTKQAPDGTPVPVVFVANASHASYPVADIDSRGLLPDDEHRGNRTGGPIRPRFESLSASAGVEWIAWPGKWGSSDDVVRGPLFQGDKSSQPTKWDEEVNQDCAGSAAGSLKRSASSRASGDGPPSASSLPPKPHVTASRTGDTVLVAYRVGRASHSAARPVSILFTIRSAQPRRYAPSGRAFVLRRLSGQTRLKLPYGPGPYVLKVSSVSRVGSRSAMASVALE